MLQPGRETGHDAAREPGQETARAPGRDTADSLPARIPPVVADDAAEIAAAREVMGRLTGRLDEVEEALARLDG